LRRKLCTVGYTGFSIEEFSEKLAENGVECLVDIREIPISRKPGFSKSALRENLEKTGITYHHYRLLGSPRHLRHDFRETGDFKTFFAKVHRHIASSEATSQLQEVIRVARHASACLMCCCPDWEFCHRKCVVEAISKQTYFSYEHLQRESLVSKQRRVA
jgi:uncharacterized protein (DUF488 family)